MTRPYTIIFFTQTVDGKLASIDRYSKLSCPEDKKRQYWLRCQVEGVLVGANTVLIDNPRLYPKLCLDSKSKYYRIVLDGNLRVSPRARIFDTRRFPTIIITSVNAPRNRKEEFVNIGVEVVEVPSKGEGVDLLKAMDILVNNYGIRSILVEGGGTTIWSFVNEGIFDELRVTLSPIIFGGLEAVHSVSGKGFKGVEAPKLKLEFVGICKCLNEVHLIYKPLKVRSSPCSSLRIGVLNNFYEYIDLSEGREFGKTTSATDKASW